MIEEMKVETTPVTMHLHEAEAPVEPMGALAEAMADAETAIVNATGIPSAMMAGPSGMPGDPIDPVKVAEATEAMAKAAEVAGPAPIDPTTGDPIPMTE